MNYKFLASSNVLVILFILTLALLSLIPIYVHKTSLSLSMPTIYQEIDKPTIPSNSLSNDARRTIRVGKKCNMVKGNWVRDPKMPYYTNETKCVIDNRQNCLKFGRKDTEFMRWRWKPEDDGCELRRFDAGEFLELVRGKAMAFIGDSVARNQMQSLICLLTNVSRPLDISFVMEESEHYFYSDYNFTLALLWNTHLVRADLGPDPFKNTPSNLTLDEPDSSWVSEIQSYDFALVSSGHWFLKPLRYYEKGKFVGCHICPKEQATDRNVYHAYRMAFRTAFRTLLGMSGFKGTVFLRTITGSHVDHKGGSWTEDGDCGWTRPFRKEEVREDEVVSEMYSIQLEEFKAAEREGRKRELKFGLLDITEPMALRPDGHPNRYGHWPHEKIRRPDCLHWCLPGPVDLWNEMLLQMMKTESERQVYGKSE